jgi:hypothetical protein
MKSADLTADVVVVGGGTAGCAAAIAAARRGHGVLLVEEGNALGGTSTSGGVWEWFASQDGLGDIFDRLKMELNRYGSLRGRHFNGEHLKLIWQLLAEEAGVEILLHGSAIGAATEGGRVTGISVASCSKVLEVSGKVFIDCTGEGDLAALAGADFAQGDPQTGRTLHMTLTFTLCDTGASVVPYLPEGLEPIESQTELPGLLAMAPLVDGRVYCNMTKVMGHDPTDPLDLSAAELQARRQVAQVVHYLQRNGYPTFTLGSTGSHIGVREGRRIVGDYVLSEDDILGPTPRDFADGVAVATAQVDFHSLTKPGNDGWRQRVEPYTIPLRCLLVRGLSNMLVAGKCLSADQVAQSSLRMTPTCCATGQAAGTAAAWGLEAGVADLRSVDVESLRGQLRAAGMELDPAKHEAFAPCVTPDRGQAR